jgi:hypothetical protein
MKRFAVSALLFSLSLAAQAAPPTLESIERLMAISQADKLTDMARSQIRGSMKLVTDQMLQGQPVTAGEQRAIDRFTAKVNTMVNEELSTDKLRPIYVVMYRETFTQEEVDGMIAFYQSPVGQSMLAKMPRAMQGINDEMARRMGPLMDRMKQAAQEMRSELESSRGPAPRRSN